MARIYTTRQLLDPRYVDMMNQAVNRRLDMASQDRANLLGSLSRTVGAASTGFGKYLDEETGKETRRALVGNYGTNDPLKTAAAEKFIQTGDPSAMLSIDQMEKTFQARQEEKDQREAEELDLKKQLFQNAVENIDTYKNDPEREIVAINNAIEKGIAANEDVTELRQRLKEKQAEKEDLLKEKEAEKEEVEWASKVSNFEEEREKQQLEYEKEMDENIKKILKEQIAGLKKIPSVKEYNYVLNRLKETAERHGMVSDFSWPIEQSEYRTPEEEDRLKPLLEKERDEKKGYAPMSEVDRAELNRIRNKKSRRK